MKKKLWSSLLALTLVAGALAGCSEETGKTDEKGGEEKISLRIGGWASSPEEQKILDNQIAAFEKANPNIDVKFEPVVGDYLQKLQPLIASKTEPDIFYLDAYVAPKFMAEGVTEPIDSYLGAAGVNLSDYEEAAVKAFQWEGKTYGLPKDYNTLALFYNKDMFEKAGLQPPTTLAELEAAAKALTKDGVTGFSMGAELPRYQPFLVSAGGSVYEDGKATFNKPENEPVLDLIFGKMAKEKTYQTPKQIGADWAGDAFASGKVAMVVEGSWLIPHLKAKAPDLKYGIVELPTAEGGQPSNLIFTVAYALSKNSKHKEEAVKLMAFLTGKEGQQFVVEGGLALPTNKEMGQEYTTKYPEREAFVKGAAYALPFQYGVIGVDLVDAGNKAAEAIVLGVKPNAKAALEEAQSKMK